MDTSLLSSPQFVPNMIKDQAADLLRQYIIIGKIPGGCKVTEREIAGVLGIGRMPARDALMSLEHEGLVVSRSDGRYVVDLKEKDVRDIYTIRRLLEKSAVELAAQNTNPANQAKLNLRLHAILQACEARDSNLTTPADLALHEEIWRQSNNDYLVRLLESLRGVIYVIVMQGSSYGTRNWEGLYQSHFELVSLINQGDWQAAGKHITETLERSFAWNLQVLSLMKSEPR
jgi:DNA-binding GntR family transcriptional regulator